MMHMIAVLVEVKKFNMLFNRGIVTWRTGQLFNLVTVTNKGFVNTLSRGNRTRINIVKLEMVDHSYIFGSIVILHPPCWHKDKNPKNLQWDILLGWCVMWEEDVYRVHY